MRGEKRFFDYEADVYVEPGDMSSQYVELKDSVRLSNYHRVVGIDEAWHRCRRRWWRHVLFTRRPKPLMIGAGQPN